MEIGCRETSDFFYSTYIFSQLLVLGRQLFVTFVFMKIRINWKRLLVFVVVSAGLVYITKSFLMSAGIFLLLFVADNLLVRYEENNRKSKQEEEHEQRD